MIMLYFCSYKSTLHIYYETYSVSVMGLPVLKTESLNKLI